MKRCTLMNTFSDFHANASLTSRSDALRALLQRLIHHVYRDISSRFVGATLGRSQLIGRPPSSALGEGADVFLILSRQLLRSQFQTEWPRQSAAKERLRLCFRESCAHLLCSQLIAVASAVHPLHQAPAFNATWNHKAQELLPWHVCFFPMAQHGSYQFRTT